MYIMPKNLQKQIVTGLVKALSKATTDIVHAYTSDKSIIWAQVEADPEYSPIYDLQELVNVMGSHAALIKKGPF